MSKNDIFNVLPILNDEVEAVFLESETKHSKLLESKVGHSKHFRKWFSSYLEVKNECCKS